MKTRFLAVQKWVTALVCVPMLTACYDESAQNAAPAPAPAVAPTNPPVPATVAVPTGTNAPVIKNFDPSTLNLSPGLVDVIKLAQSGVSEEVMADFVAKSPQAYKLTADEIVYLNDLGIPSPVISAMLRKEAVEPVAPAPVAPAPEITPAQAPPPAPPPAQQPAPETPATTVVQPVYVQPAQPVTYQYFYDSLAPYGSWVYVSDYGYCWRPTVAVINVGWRPYCHGGRWLYSDCGWYWQSDYTWGWAPFHYGRWQLHGSYGWMWTPDTCWGPSWVSWRYSAGYYGWAPLPPSARYTVGVGFSYFDSHVGLNFGFGLGYSHYTFVPSHRFYDRNVYQHTVVGQQAQTIYNNTTVINNYITGDNNTIVNKGIARDEVARQTKADIATIAVRDLPANSPAGAHPDRIARDGNKQVVYRQALPQKASLDGSAAIKAPAPAVAALARNGNAGLANNASARANVYAPPARHSATSADPAPTATTPVRPSVSRAGMRETPATTTPSGTRPSTRTYDPPKSPAAPTAPVAPSAPALTTPNRATTPSRTTPSYTPPSRSAEVPSAPSARNDPLSPSYTPPARTTPSYTPPARNESPRTATPSTPSTPSYTPPSRSTPDKGSTSVTPSYTPSSRYAAQSAPASTPPAPSTPSYTPSGRFAPSTPSYTPPAPSTPSYTPPARSFSAPSAPSYSPPARSFSAPSAPSYTPPARSFSAPSAPSYTPPARSFSAPSAPSYSPPARSFSSPAAPSSAPARSFAPSSTPRSGGGASGSDSRRSR